MQESSAKDKEEAYNICVFQESKKFVERLHPILVLHTHIQMSAVEPKRVENLDMTFFSTLSSEKNSPSKNETGNNIMSKDNKIEHREEHKLDEVIAETFRFFLQSDENFFSYFKNELQPLFIKIQSEYLLQPNEFYNLKKIYKKIYKLIDDILEVLEVKFDTIYETLGDKVISRISAQKQMDFLNEIFGCLLEGFGKISQSLPKHLDFKNLPGDNKKK